MTSARSTGPAEAGHRVFKAAICCTAILVFLLSGWERPASARQQTGGELDVVQIRPNFYVVAGAGGNIVVHTGPEGIILVDSGTTEAADNLLKMP